VPRSSRRWIIALVATVLVAGLVGGGLALAQWRADQAAARAAARAATQADQAARTAATDFARAWQGESLATVAYDGATGEQVRERYAALTRGLQGAKPTVSLTSVRRTGATADGAVRVSWALPGGSTWAYDRPLRLTQTGETFAVQPTSTQTGQSLFAPVAETSRLDLERVSPDRGDILGPDGAPIVTEGPVVRVGVQPSRVTAPPAELAQTLSRLVGVDAGQLEQRITRAEPTSFVDVITLRRNDYDRLRDQLQPLPGVLFRTGTQALAPTREFARALLGTVGPVTSAIVQEGRGRYASGDVAGVSGLQNRYDERLGGDAGTAVTEQRADGAPPVVLFQKEGTPGRPITVSLDVDVQRAADAALAGSSVPAAIVAVDVPTGRVLAVANSPASGLNQAMVGQYPPGSTFKVVSTYGLLGKGLSDDEQVACPPTASVDGRSFKNYESEEFGTVPFRTDFAESCNTAFVALSSRLDADDLTASAAALGIGAEYELGAPAYSGDVPTTTSDVDKAAATFGQGRVLVSPLAVTVATASVARGSYLAPTLVLDPLPAPAKEPVPLGPQASTLRSLMREVVVSGTGEALRGVPGGPVSAKTGTAEFGTERPPRTHAWITGWQGDVAFTVFVAEGRSGGTVAGPVAARFLTSLARR
jgi:cell division protein FtsI/penicillin-binding protein 2/Flp pilus assembly protein TadG